MNILRNYKPYNVLYSFSKSNNQDGRVTAYFSNNSNNNFLK